MKTLRNIIFYSIATLHVLIWVFVLLAFLNTYTAKINLYIVIPFIYCIHILPFHILVQSKINLFGKEHAMKKENEYNQLLIIPYYFSRLQEFLEKKCFLSPISGQGMLILGYITSLYKLHPPKKILKIKQDRKKKIKNKTRSKKKKLKIKQDRKKKNF